MVGRLNIVNTVVLPQGIYKFSIISVIIPTPLFLQKWKKKANPKTAMELQVTSLAKIILNVKNQARGLTFIFQNLLESYSNKSSVILKYE